MSKFNNLNLSTEIQRMIRPRRIYLSSDIVSDFFSSSEASYILQENIRAEEGFNLAFGVASLGFNSTVFNISESLGNNKIDIKLYYHSAALIVDPDSEDPDLDGNYHYVYNPEVWSPLAGNSDVFVFNDNEKFIIFTITLPDGFYPTLQSIFDYLNNTSNYSLNSQIYYNIHKKIDNYDNYVEYTDYIPIRLFFEETTVGYTISCELGSEKSENNIKNFYQDSEKISGYTVGYDAYHLNNRPFKLEILPHQISSNQYNPILYNLLFTNDTSTKNKSAQAPSFISDTGLDNPPLSIIFDIRKITFNSNLSIDNPSSSIKIAFKEDEFIIPDNYLIFKAYSKNQEELLKDIHKISTTTVPSIYFRFPFTSYFKPRINPFFIDVNSDLQTNNMTDFGSNRNILIRQFIPGNGLGVTDFFKSWDQPVWHTTLSQNINAIRINFESESNKWNFYNLTFLLELIFFEYPESNEMSSYATEQFVLPTEDPLTSQLNMYLGPSNNPLQINSHEKREGNFLINDRTKKLKRK